MNKHDKKEVMNLIKFKKMLKGDKTMLDKEIFNDVVTALMNGEEIDEFEHQGYMLNPDKNHVNLIIEGLKKKDGYCPCRVQKVEENICCCTDFIENGHCCCRLWVDEYRVKYPNFSESMLMVIKRASIAKEISDIETIKTLKKETERMIKETVEHQKRLKKEKEEWEEVLAIVEEVEQYE